uniref:Uncharacterized protein n=1 Tax=Anguilla anguilla TaxID=7936 RepID=A0A0E9PUU4_ANGAN
MLVRCHFSAPLTAHKASVCLTE